MDEDKKNQDKKLEEVIMDSDIETEYIDNDEGAVEQIKKLREKLKVCTKEKTEYLDGWQRQKADFVNYKKAERERMDNVVKFAKEGLVFELLNILDSFDLALKHTPDNLKDDQWTKGIMATRTQFENILKQEGVEKIPAERQKFNPAMHESISEEESEEEEGKILEEIQSGYILHGKVLRPSKVKIAKFMNHES